jgi:lipopolysaccharide export system protein LptA
MTPALAVLLACGGDVPQLDADGPDLVGVTVEVMVQPEPIVMQLGSAWIEEDGGHGVGASASVPPDLIIEGDTSSWSLSDGRVVFQGHVTVTRPPVTVSCAKLVVTYADDHVDLAVATGDVVVRRGERVARGEHAVLEPVTGRVVLTGSPMINDGPRTLSGDRIELFLDDERLECSGCRLVVEGSAVTP